MPQMKPSMWIMIMMLSSSMLLMMMTINHFQYNPKNPEKKKLTIFIESMKWK